MEYTQTKEEKIFTQLYKQELILKDFIEDCRQLGIEGMADKLDGMLFLNELEMKRIILQSV